MTTHTIRCPLGNAEVIVEYDYQPAESFSLEHPGCPEEVELTDVLVDGVSVDVCDFSQAWIDRTVEYILETLAAEREYARQEYETSRKYE
jgi:hypothetical protein